MVDISNLTLYGYSANNYLINSTMHVIGSISPLPISANFSITIYKKIFNSPVLLNSSFANINIIDDNTDNDTDANNTNNVDATDNATDNTNNATDNTNNADANN